MPSVVGSVGVAATSVTIPGHQVGDLILIAARGTAGAPAVPAAGGTVPAWVTLQSALANALGLTVVAYVATATNHTSGTFTNAVHTMVVVLRPTAGSTLSTAAARSSVGNGNNTQTIVYPALTFTDLDGSSFGVRFGARNVAVAAVNNPPTGWTYLLAQPISPGALLVAHTRSAITSSPTADSVATAGTNSAYRAVTIEVLELIPAQNRSVSGIPSGQAFGTVLALAHQKLSVAGVKPTGYVATITATATKASKSQTITGGKRVATFGVPTAGITVSGTVSVAGLGSAQTFGVPLAKAVFTRTVAGLGSAQAFGTPIPKTTITRTVTGLGSAQAFGAATAKGSFTRAVVGIPSAQAFSTVTIVRGTVTSPNAGVSSAAAFGTLRFWLKRPVAGLSSAQAFGVFKTRQGALLGGVPSAQAFGAIITRTGFSVSVAGVPSAKAFGTVRPAYGVRATGLGSAQTFGVFQLKARITKTVAGVGSAQAFDSSLYVRNVWIWPTTYFPSTGGSLTNQVICGDGHTVGGWDYLPATSRPQTLELDPHQVSTLDLEPTLAK